MIQKPKGQEHRKSQRPCGKTVKPVSHRKNRAATRDALSHGEYDKFFKGEVVKEEDSWAWD